jgi:trimethylamine--corrinoid protein Co-methyltransferase
MKKALVAQRGVRFQKLTPADCAAIHEASLRLLARVGVEVHHERAQKILEEAGATVEGTRVRLPEELVAWALSVVPRGFTPHTRDGEPVMPVRGLNVFFGVGSARA